MLNATQQLKAESYAMGTTVAEAVVGIKNAWNEAVETFVKATDANTELVNRLEKISEWIRSDGIDAIASLAGGILAFVDALQKAIDQAKPFADMLNSIAAAAQSAGVAVNQAFGGTGGPVAAAKRGATGTWGLPEGQAVETLSAPGTKATKPGTLQQSPWDIVKAPQGEFGSMVQKRPVVLGPPTEKKGGAKGKKDEKIPLNSKPFEDELTKLNQLMEESTTKTQRDAKALFDNLTKANLQAKGDQVKLIEMTRDKEMDAINLAALSAEDKAKARVMVEETTSAQIIAIRQRETDQSKSLLASLEEASLRSHGQTTAAEKVASAERKRSALSAIEQNKALSPADKTTAKAYVEDINREKTAMEQAGLTLQQFGEGLTGVRGHDARRHSRSRQHWLDSNICVRRRYS